MLRPGRRRGGCEGSVWEKNVTKTSARARSSCKSLTGRRGVAVRGLTRSKWLARGRGSACCRDDDEGDGDV